MSGLPASGAAPAAPMMRRGTKLSLGRVDAAGAVLALARCDAAMQSPFTALDTFPHVCFTFIINSCGACSVVTGMDKSWRGGQRARCGLGGH